MVKEAFRSQLCLKVGTARSRMSRGCRKSGLSMKTRLEPTILLTIRKEFSAMRTAIVFDCEFICLQGSQNRFWCAAHDPDPVIAQIGAVKLGLGEDFPLLETFKAYVRPTDRFGNRYAIDPFFTKLTGITEEDIEIEGLALQDALAKVDAFSGGARFWSWGKDELNMVAISCYIAGVPAPIPATRFDNAVKLFIAAGMPIEDIARTRATNSPTIMVSITRRSSTS
jgi:hypothetical protein